MAATLQPLSSIRHACSIGIRVILVHRCCQEPLLARHLEVHKCTFCKTKPLLPRLVWMPGCKGKVGATIDVWLATDTPWCDPMASSDSACTGPVTLHAAMVQVFDDKATFAEWFGDALGKGSQSAAADEWLATEKRVVVIHRLHQILEPFMLRRQVQDVEGKLPPKVGRLLSAIS